MTLKCDHAGRHVFSLDPTQSFQPALERGGHHLTSMIILSAGDQRADASDALQPLRASRERLGTAVLPSPAMNSRRFIRSPRWRARPEGNLIDCCTKFNIAAKECSELGKFVRRRALRCRYGRAWYVLSSRPE